MKFQFNFKFAGATIILFLIEVGIATCQTHHIVRSYIGDVLVIILLFTFIRTFFKIASEKLVLWILIFAFVIEFLQLFQLAETFNIQSHVFRIIIGSVFDPWDLVAYVIGSIIILVMLKFFRRKQPN
ncbi:ribosomal maturation YjgA family protein [Ulvibacter antarcticus]|uniref:Uncharacterized protein DUF2809 n=1 Tax=Ulvibacter antarcticus TaxID=442714 RepID=A0A3L9Y8R5_9FLAO|nr:uncharacterized protein DUF2809 [Ulvibacter antarcticus]